MLSFVRHPLFHFVVIGALIGLLHAWLGGPDTEGPDRAIRITATDISRMAAQWQARWNRPPTTAEMDGLVRAKVRESALYREALAMGLDQDDAVIRRVLVQKLEGMAKDLVELSLAPTDQDLEVYFAENGERYRPSPLITFTHVFVDPDQRDEDTLDDADRMLAELQSLGNPIEDAERFGDPFMLQSYYPEKPEDRIASLFGREFARTVFELEPERWHGPVLSGYGTHLVYVVYREAFSIPALSEVREQVTQDWVDEKRQEITDQYFADVLARYDVIIEGEPARERVEAASVPVP